jgi:hypothetical protein
MLGVEPLEKRQQQGWNDPPFASGYGADLEAGNLGCAAALYEADGSARRVRPEDHADWLHMGVKPGVAAPVDDGQHPAVQGAPEGRCISRGGDFRRHEQREDAARGGERHRSLEKRDRKIGLRECLAGGPTEQPVPRAEHTA